MTDGTGWLQGIRVNMRVSYLARGKHISVGRVAREADNIVVVAGHVLLIVFRLVKHNAKSGNVVNNVVAGIQMQIVAGGEAVVAVHPVDGEPFAWLLGIALGCFGGSHNGALPRLNRHELSSTVGLLFCKNVIGSILLLLLGGVVMLNLNAAETYDCTCA
jgi:hypothetical protein